MDQQGDAANGGEQQSKQDDEVIYANLKGVSGWTWPVFWKYCVIHPE